MLAYLVASGAVIILVMLHRRDRQRIKTQRTHFYDACLDLFQSYRVTQEGFELPSAARHLSRPTRSSRPRNRQHGVAKSAGALAQGHAPEAQSLSRRAGSPDAAGRGRGVSPSAELDHHVPLPDGWPEQALLCTDEPSLAPPLDLLGPHMALFSDPYMKELLVTPRGVSLVRMIWQASRCHYVVFREIKFDGDELDRVVRGPCSTHH